MKKDIEKTYIKKITIGEKTMHKIIIYGVKNNLNHQDVLGKMLTILINNWNEFDMDKKMKAVE